MKPLLLSVFIFSLPALLSASELTKATTLKLHSPDGLTNVASLKVTLSVRCTYKFGLIFPENKSCGESTKKLAVDSDGKVLVPAIEKFSGFNARKTSNYDIGLSIYDGEEAVSFLAAWGEKRISNFNFDGKQLDIYRINGAVINVSYEGADFFGSELSKVDRASLGLMIDEIGAESSYEEVMPVSSFEALLWSKENFLSYAGKHQLKDTKEIALPNLAFGKFNSTGQEKFEVSLYYQNTIDYKAAKLKGKAVISLGKDALGSIGAIELKK